MENIMPQMIEAANFDDYFKNNTQLGPEVVEEYFSKRLKDGCSFSDYSNLSIQLEHAKGYNHKYNYTKTGKDVYYDGQFAVVLERRIEKKPEFEDIYSFYLEQNENNEKPKQLTEIEEKAEDVAATLNAYRIFSPLALISAHAGREDARIVQIQACNYDNFRSNEFGKEFIEKFLIDKTIQNFRWEMALVELFLDTGARFGISDITIQSAEHNKWNDRRPLEELKIRYDVTAKRYRDQQGRRFVFDEQSRDWRLKTNSK